MILLHKTLLPQFLQHMFPLQHMLLQQEVHQHSHMIQTFLQIHHLFQQRNHLHQTPRRHLLQALLPQFDIRILLSVLMILPISHLIHLPYLHHLHPNLLLHHRKYLPHLTWIRNHPLLTHHSHPVPWHQTHYHHQKKNHLPQIHLHRHQQKLLLQKQLLP